MRYKRLNPCIKEVREVGDLVGYRDKRGEVIIQGKYRMNKTRMFTFGSSLKNKTEMDKPKHKKHLWFDPKVLFEIFYSSVRTVSFVGLFLGLSGCAMTGGPNIKNINKYPVFLTANDHNDFGRILLHGEKIQHDIPIELPANAPSILSDYKSNFSPTGQKRKNYPRNPSGHDGIDIAVPIGYPVLAVADGIVVKSYTSSIGGNMLVIEHWVDKDGFIVGTSYLHNDENLVLEGDQVNRGQYIARSGHTGSFRGGIPHLHFEVFRVKSRKDIEPFCDGYWWSHPDNPHKYWMDGRGKITCFDRNANYVNDNLKFVYPVLCK